MGSLLGKIADMEANGELPQFDPTNMSDVLRLASERGLKHMIMMDAMDILRDNPRMTNEEVVLLAAKNWQLI
tara:strand:+ start:6552 stop:6767 length:216 start_codon:yes stop_codon:yes gene_type:complete